MDRYYFISYKYRHRIHDTWAAWIYDTRVEPIHPDEWEAAMSYYGICTQFEVVKYAETTKADYERLLDDNPSAPIIKDPDWRRSLIDQ